MSNLSSVWGKLDLSRGPFSIPLAENSQITISRDEREVLVSVQVDGNEKISRFVTGDDHNVYLEPGLPDLPLMIKPSAPVSILPSKKLESLIEVPLVVRILFGSSKSKRLLMEHSCRNMSKSFFGTLEGGEFAYSIESPLHHEVGEYKDEGFTVFCPLTIHNKSSYNLEFEKMILRVPFLSIYGNRQELMANTVVISFSGPDQISQIQYKKVPPGQDGEFKMLAPPQKEGDKNLLLRSFYFLKNLYLG